MGEQLGTCQGHHGTSLRQQRYIPHVKQAGCFDFKPVEANSTQTPPPQDGLEQAWINYREARNELAAIRSQEDVAIEFAREVLRKAVKKMKDAECEPSCDGMMHADDCWYGNPENAIEKYFGISDGE